MFRFWTDLTTEVILFVTSEEVLLMLNALLLGMNAEAGAVARMLARTAERRKNTIFLKRSGVCFVCQ